MAAVVGLLAVVSVVASAQTESPVANPTLTARCGLRVMLVLDESNSIRTFANALTGTRDASDGFVEALEGTGSPLAITAFHSFGRPGPPEVPQAGVSTGVGYAEVTPGNAGMFTNWIHNRVSGGYNPPTSVSTPNPAPGSGNTTSPNGTTNWEDAFDQVERTPGGPPQLVVFVTDGNPNTVNAPGNSGAAPTASGRRFFGENPDGWAQATPAAVPSANRVKRAGARIFGIGVGPAVTDEASAERLKEVTGPREGTNPITADYTLVTDFTDLRAELTHVVASLCGSTLTITKYVAQVHGAPWTPAPGWTFTAALDSPHHWLEPPRGTHREATLTTNDAGVVRFLWRLPEAETRATVGPTKETLKPGLHFVVAECQTHHAHGSPAADTRSTREIPGARLGREDWHTCQVYNAPEKPGNGLGEVLDIPSGQVPNEPGGQVPAGPRLSVSKRMPAHATVGDRVPLTIKVKNTGGKAAHDVQVHEGPPPGGKIVAAADKGSIKHDGTVVWNVGSLGPGKSRTVHATVLVTHPGLHLNVAVAGAADGYPAYDGVQYRDTGPPAFTG